MIFHINDKDQWQPVVDKWRAEGKVIVTTNGTFDIVHVGHIRLMTEAKAQGDILILGLNSDKSVKQYKSEKRPIVPQEERAKLIEALRCIDMVIIFDEPESARFVTEVKPDIHAKDSTYGYDLIEAPIVAEYGGKIYLVEKDGHSTTNVIQKIIDVYKDEL